MRHSYSEVLSNAAVAKIDLRRRDLNLTRSDLLLRFTDALTSAHGSRADGSAKMRLNRVLNPRLRRPLSESTKAALARSLEWTLDEFDEHALERGRRAASSSEPRIGHEAAGDYELSCTVQQLESAAKALSDTTERLTAIVQQLATRATIAREEQWERSRT